MPQLQIALVGLGFMGATHARAGKSVPNVRLAGVVDTDEKKLSGDLRDVGGNLGVPGEILDFSGVGKYRRFKTRSRIPQSKPSISACRPICMPPPPSPPFVPASTSSSKSPSRSMKLPPKRWSARPKKPAAF